jgi:hypothetical protein
MDSRLYSVFAGSDSDSDDNITPPQQPVANTRALLQRNKGAKRSTRAKHERTKKEDGQSSGESDTPAPHAKRAAPADDDDDNDEDKAAATTDRKLDEKPAKNKQHADATKPTREAWYVIEKAMMLRAEAALAHMSQRFEDKCVELVRKMEAERKKSMSADLLLYKKQMEDVVTEHAKALRDYAGGKKGDKSSKKSLYETLFRKPAATASNSSSSSEDDGAKPATDDKHSEAAVAKQQPSKKKAADKAPAPQSRYNLRSSKPVAKTAASFVPPIFDEDLGGWGSDVSDKELAKLMVPTLCKDDDDDCGKDDDDRGDTIRDDNDKEGMHETVHKLILCMQELPNPTHDQLDGLWVSLSNIHLDGPTRADIEDILDRQAALVQILIVLQDKVASEAIRTHVSPNTLYCWHAEIQIFTMTQPEVGDDAI